MNDPQRTQPARRGVALLVTMLGLLIVVSLVASLLDHTRAHQKQIGLRRQLRQAELLLSAGCDRGLLRLTGDAEYTGETWEPRIRACEAARVELKRIKRESRPDSLSVSVALLFDGVVTVRRSCEYALPTLSPPTNREN